MATSRVQGGGSGTSTNALVFGGEISPGAVSALTEEYNDNSEPNQFLNIGQVFYNTTEQKFKYTGESASTWSIGGNLNTGRTSLTAAAQSTVTAGLVFGGNAPPFNPTEEYNGTSWSAANNMGTARYAPGGAGTQTAGLAISGFTSVGNQTTACEEYDGTNWASGGSIGTARYRMAGVGSQTAALACAGSVSPGTRQSLTEEYDGSSWTAGGAVASARYVLAGAGTQTAGMICGGQDAPGTILNNTQHYDGSSWTNSGNLNTARMNLNAAGTQTLALAYGGQTPPSTGVTEEYNGTTWAVNSGTMNNGRGEVAGAGTQNEAFAAGGVPPAKTQTEEFVYAGTATIKTVTTS